MARGTPDNQGPIKAPAFLQGNGASDTRDMQTERESSMQLNPTGSIADMDRTDIEGLQPMQDNDDVRNHMANLQFDKDILTVMVQDTNEAGAEAVVQVGVNGVNQFFPRGVPVKAKRMFIEGLARAKPQRIATADQSHMKGDGDQYTVRRHSALAYPFSVIHDPAGQKGADWLAKVLMQG